MTSRTKFFVVLLSGLSMVGTLSAQATRTWVSGVGDDANPCSRTAPCKTFAGAIVKTTAGGEIDALDPGGFGAITITKAITIDGGGGQVASILVSGTNGITIAAGATDMVTIRNLRIDGIAATGSAGLNGVQVNSASAVHVEKCAIFGFSGDGITFEPGAQAFLFVVDSELTNNTMHGLHAMGSGTSHAAVSAINSHFDNNGIGLLADTLSSVTVVNSSANGNQTGFSATPASGTTQMAIAGSVASLNLVTGVQVGSGGTVYLSGSTVTENTVALTLATGAVVNSYGNNVILGSGSPTTTLALK